MSGPRRAARVGSISPEVQFGVAAGALAALGVVVWALAVGAHWYLGWLLAWSVATFALYGIDKRQARAHGLRVPERVLHGLALVGGAAGGWAGMFVFRHKTQHAVFYAILAVASVLQLALGWWLLVGPGR